MKKLLIIILLVIVSISGSAVNYYFSSSGNDSNLGTSVNSPWKTLSKFNYMSFSPRDTILFRKGDTFRGYAQINSSGNSNGYITVKSYGTGGKPKIWNSIDASLSSQWTNYSGNIWRTTSAVSSSSLNDCGVITFNNEASYGVKRSTLSDCTSQGNYYYNTSDDRVYMYSASNPAIYYSHIEIGGIYAENCFTVSGDYIVLDGLNIQYGANNAIFLNSGTSNVIIQNCEIAWTGGMYYGGVTHGMGNGVQMWEWVSDVIIRCNHIHDCYDTGISPQGNGTYTQSNITMCYNLIERCYWTYEIFVGGDSNTRTLTNIKFENNTCSNASSWSESWRADTDRATHVRTWQEANAIRTNLTIKNNIFYLAKTAGYTHYYSCVFDSDYNLFYLDNVGFINTTYYNTLSRWQNATNKDRHSLSGDPLFNSDYILQESSPAVGAGTNLGYSTDYNGDPIVGTPDMGAFEYQGEEYVEQLINLVIEGHSFVAPGTSGATIIPSVVDYSSLHNVGMGGSEIEDVESRAATVDGYLVSESSTLQNVLCLWIGVNDLSYIVGEGATHYALLKSYVEDRVAAGWDVFAFTITPSDAYGRGAQFEIERNVFNDLMRNDLNALAGVHVLNTDAVPQLVDIDNTYYWPTEPGGGALHPSAAAITLAADLFSSAVESFWGGEEPVPVGDTGIVVSDGKFVVTDGKLVKKN